MASLPGRSTLSFVHYKSKMTLADLYDFNNVLNTGQGDAPEVENKGGQSDAALLHLTFLQPIQIAKYHFHLFLLASPGSDWKSHG